MEKTMSQEDSFYLGAKAFIINEYKEILLLQRNIPKSLQNIEDRDKAIWDLPGGRVQKGESLIEALKREVFEETGLQLNNPPKSFFMGLTQIRLPFEGGDKGLVFATYICKTKKAVPIKLSKEHLNYRWVFPLEAARLLPPDFPEEIRSRISQIS